MDPGEVATGLVDEVKDGLLIVASGYQIADISATLETLSRCFQSLAICRLLESADLVKYRDNLARSAFARRFFLRKCAEGNNLDDRRLALGRTEAFFDALAAGHGLLAREIASLSLDTWHEGWEYEDDFWYFLFLHRLVLEPSWLGEPPSLELLRRFEIALQGDEPPRLIVVRSLVARDQAALEAGLRALMQEREEEAQVRKDRRLEPDLEAFLHWPRSFVSVEGLALIAIARALQLEVADDVPLCPPIGRLGFSDVAAEDPFLGIESELRRSAH
jgi:hypothetical protein